MAVLSCPNPVIGYKPAAKHAGQCMVLHYHMTYIVNNNTLYNIVHELYGHF